VISYKSVIGGALALSFAASLAVAQTPEMVRVRATIESVDGSTLTVKSRDGVEMKIKLADNAPVNEVVKAALSDIKPNSYVAVTAMPQPDGSQKATAVIIFPEAMRGVGDGHRPWDYVPNSTMTNATVDNAVTSVDGEKLVVKYKDGDKTIMLSPSTEIATYAKKSLADLKPGQKIFIAGAKKLPDGTLDAPNVSFGDYAVWR
jgi:preprotein translocase subunit YajC